MDPDGSCATAWVKTIDDSEMGKTRRGIPEEHQGKIGKAFWY